MVADANSFNQFGVQAEVRGFIPRPGTAMPSPSRFNDYAQPGEKGDPGAKKAVGDAYDGLERAKCRWCDFKTIHLDRIGDHEETCPKNPSYVPPPTAIAPEGAAGVGLTREDVKAAVAEAVAPLADAMNNLAAALGGKLIHKPPKTKGQKKHGSPVPHPRSTPPRGPEAVRPVERPAVALGGDAAGPDQPAPPTA
jgi:hypothetical protein